MSTGRQGVRLSQAGIGGVLRDHRGKVLCMFSASIGIQDAVTAEIQAISKACNLCVSRPELGGKIIDFVSDSKVAVSWINSTGIGNWKQMQEIYEIRSLLNILGQARVVFSTRASNSFADMLAKKGSGEGVDFISWSDI
ncbi:hypothetical protein Dsin_022011 [Dipteronia sinensis]|uniref:RNase H type-1 domain-containing protein n=1 Tax=Dipteronia sinensis TaxID=43782 RepID=A0AAE0DZI7_9ROSI|nr:hypothetical protein Dsin_022011 [Dipteronia sinensis]